MFLEIATHAAVTGAFEALEHRKQIAEMWNRFAYILKHKKLSVLIVGPGGVGKSTLSRFLCAPTLKVPPSKYDESFHTERLSLPGNAVADLVTAPGQRWQDGKWDAIFDDVKLKGRTFGVINVVAYGYHSHMFEMTELREKFQTTNAATTKFLGDCRLKEIDLANELIKYLAKLTKPFWMITLVTKQDLWWPDRKAIEKHYKEGPYAEAIRKIELAHSASGFRHEFFSMSVHAQNLVDDEGRVIQNTASGYDDIIKYAHQQKFLEIVRGFVDPRVS